MVDTLNDHMAVCAEETVKLVRSNYRKELDYAPMSVAVLETVLDDIFQNMRETLSENSNLRETVYLGFGAYIGEVIRRQKVGGDWVMNEQFDTCGVLFPGDKWIFPVAKVEKRLSNGKEDDVDFFYNIAINQILADIA